MINQQLAQLSTLLNYQYAQHMQQHLINTEMPNVSFGTSKYWFEHEKGYTKHIAVFSMQTHLQLKKTLPYIAFLVQMYSVTRNKGQQVLVMFIGVESYVDFVRLKHI